MPLSLATLDPYPPLGTLKPVAGDVWIVDGPNIAFGPGPLALPFSTRMTVIRLADGGLFIHSPTPLTPQLGAELAHFGVPRFIIGPNRLHYWWIPEWSAAFPHAEAFLAPEIARQSAGRKRVAGALLREWPVPWSDEIDTLAVKSAFMTEFVFFHRASRTLVLTDLIENFEAGHLHSAWLKLATWLGGALDPDGGTPRDLRYMFRRYKAPLRTAVETMMRWQPERIILAHGRCYDRDGVGELRRAFRWLLR